MVVWWCFVVIGWWLRIVVVYGGGVCSVWL